METADRYTYYTTWSEEDNEFVGSCREFPSLSVFGESHEQAITHIKEEVRFVLSWMQEEGEIIPEPLELNEFSGRLLVRIPKKLHKALAQQARENNVSINQFILTLLSENLYTPSIEKQLDVLREYVRVLGIQEIKKSGRKPQIG